MWRARPGRTRRFKKFSLWSPPAPAPGAGVCALWFILFGFGLSELGFVKEQLPPCHSERSAAE